MSSITEVAEAAPPPAVKAHEATATPATVLQGQPQQAKLPQTDPCTIVIFGASGDLARRKLIPALYNLACEGCTGNRFHVLGIGRTHLSDEDFRAQMRDAAATAKDTRDFNEESWARFAPRLTYMIGDPNDDGLLHELAAHLDHMREESDISPNTLFYLSTPPSVAPNIIQGLGAASLTEEKEGYRRIIIEKPFGSDLNSARQLNEVVARVFDEHQVYRIDHYLGKETVQNILVFRFGNSLFEPVWNRNYIDYVEITAAETLGIGGRAGYYEEAGALRDMVANHLLQLLCLTAMEPPVAFDADSVREEKVQVLRAIRPMSAEELRTRTVHGQYAAGKVGSEDAVAYKQEKGVRPGSATETYVALEFRIENWRWAGVPFYVRTGKRLARSVTEVAVHFKRTPQALFARTPDAQIEPNVIVLRIQPDEGISLGIDAKLPGTEMQTGTVRMDFSYSKGFGVRSPAAYETLLLDAMQGDATLFTRRDEVEAEWKLITPIEEAWARSESAPPLATYASGSSGPAEADQMLARNGHNWRPLG
ncbi:MAG: glucose-6-phosphate dehydrogenase [Pyrinomonadaceae bacterium]|nr:glucose-6-phosphate dehydrogenase [Pyrinomonadaceae bacterium]